MRVPFAVHVLSSQYTLLLSQVLGSLTEDKTTFQVNFLPILTSVSITWIPSMARSVVRGMQLATFVHFVIATAFKFRLRQLPSRSPLSTGNILQLLPLLGMVSTTLL